MRPEADPERRYSRYHRGNAHRLPRRSTGVAPQPGTTASPAPSPSGQPTQPSSSARIEAEAYVSTSAPLAVTTSLDALAGNQVIAVTQPNTQVGYTLIAPSAGVYALGLRLSAPDHNATLGFALGQTNQGATPPIGSTGADSVFTTYVVRNVALQAGAQTLVLILNNDGLLLDWIDLMDADPNAVDTPAQVFWSNMDHAAIAAAPDPWSFVAAHLDGLESGTSDLAQLNTVGQGILQSTPDANQMLPLNIQPGLQQNITITLQNTGDIPAMPVLRGVLQGVATNVVPSVWAGSRNVTYDVLRGHGYAVGSLVSANAMVTYTVSIAVPSGAPVARSTLVLQALWNPQDPSAAVRDTLAIDITSGS